MVTQYLNLAVPNEQRHIKARLSYADKALYKNQQLIIIATGLYSHMDKMGQVQKAESYQAAGFATLQFNFMGHGEAPNKSEGQLTDLTLSSSIKDLKTVWDYAKQLPDIDQDHIAISANSYGALVSLLAREKRLISPESMALVAPFSFDKIKPWILPLSLITKLMPKSLPWILRLPVSPLMMRDFLANHTQGMTKKDLLGNTAVHFFVGSKDTVSSVKDVKKWCHLFNQNTPKDVPFILGIQAHQAVYDGVPHFNIPHSVQTDITARTVNFIQQTRKIRSR